MAQPLLASILMCLCAGRAIANERPVIKFDQRAPTLYREHGATISVTASDPDGFVESVTFLLNGQITAVVKNPPYETSIRMSVNEPAEVTAIALDNHGASARTSVRYDVIDCPEGQLCSEELTGRPCCAESPAVQWDLIPEQLIAPANIPLKVTATTTEGKIVRVEFFVNDEKIGEATHAPWRFVWSDVKSGKYDVHAVVITSAGGQGLSPVYRMIVSEK